MHLTKRDRCAVTGAQDLEPLDGVRNFPVFMGCVNTPRENDVVADMMWSISRSSGLVQLNELIPLDVLYPESHGSGGVGSLWDKHHKAFAKFLHRFSPSRVFEVGGAHGILAKEYQQLARILWTVLEPNPWPVAGCDARFIKGFFDDMFSYVEPFDVVVHSHVFEHIYEPDRFMAHLAGFIAEGKRLVFTLPNMQKMLERKYTNCINFEHTIFLTETYVEFLLAKYGFRLTDKEYFLEDHSIFYSAVRDRTVEPAALPAGLYEKNKSIYTSYVRYHEELTSTLNSKIPSYREPVYLFGAHVFAQYLIVVGLDTSRIVCLLDNDVKKQGKRLYGTGLMVKSPKVLADVRDPVIILKAGVYNKEIRDDILKNINNRATFLE